MGFFKQWMNQGRPQAPHVVVGGMDDPELRSRYWQYLLDCTDPLSELVASKQNPENTHTMMVGGAAGELKVTDQDTSMLVLGPPRSTGKTAGAIIPAILTARGPVVTVSTKPDVAVATALHRARQGQIWQFCPDGTGQIYGMRQLRWSAIGGNWGDCLSRSTWMVQAANMSKGRDNASFWESRASDLLAVMLFYSGLRGRSMGWLVQTIAAMRLKEDFLPIVEDLASMSHSMPSGLLNGIIHSGDRTRADIFATASVVLRPYLLPGALDNTTDPNFDAPAFVMGEPDELNGLIVEDPRNGVEMMVDGKLIRQPAKHWLRQRGDFDTIYISASEENMSLVAPLIVGFLGDIQRAIYAQSRDDSLKGVPRRAAVLWAIDELASVPIPNLPTLLRDAGSQGLLVLGALQSLTQTAKWGDEGKALQTLFNNVMVLPGIRDKETLELLSLLVGEFDREVWSSTYSKKDREYQSSQSWQRMQRLAPDDIYRGNPNMPDGGLVFSRTGWMWVELQLYYRSHIWPFMLWQSAFYACQFPDIAVSGLPFPDLARNNDFSHLQRVSPALARNFLKTRNDYHENVQSWLAVMGESHTAALAEHAWRTRGLTP